MSKLLAAFRDLSTAQLISDALGGDRVGVSGLVTHELFDGKALRAGPREIGVSFEELKAWSRRRWDRLAPPHIAGFLEESLLQFQMGANLVVNEGLNYIRDSGLAGTLYVGMKGTGTPAATDVMNSHATWADLDGSETETVRETWTSAAGGTGERTNSASKAQYNFDGTPAAVFGSFLTTDNTLGGTTGTLVNAKDFTGGSKAPTSGDILNITHAITLS
jgi:hypothetical protein